MEELSKKRPAANSVAEELVPATTSLIPFFLINSSTKDSTSSILHLLPPPNWRLLRRVLLFFVSLILRLILLLLSPLFPPPPSYLSKTSAAFSDSSSSSSAPSRGLSQVLSIVSLIPVSSRKYNFARSLADRLLDENLASTLAGGIISINRAALSDAFAKTLRRLELAVPSPPVGPIDIIAGALWSGLRRIGAAVEGDEFGNGAGGNAAAEKLAAEVMWLAQKMTECGAAGEAVARWAKAAGLGRTALSADPRIQVTFVRISVFLFKHAHRMQVEWHFEDHDVDDKLSISVSQCCMLMLCTWLPLLCCASNGVDMPILSSFERAEMVRVLDEMIQKLNWEQQEEVLALWLKHFTLCPDSDWPNLESSYTRWRSDRNWKGSKGGRNWMKAERKIKNWRESQSIFRYNLERQQGRQLLFTLNFQFVATYFVITAVTVTSLNKNPIVIVRLIIQISKI